MKKLTFATAIMVAALCLTMASLSAFGQAGGQERRLTYDDWYGDVKRVLSDHYTGKTVKLKLAIPATRRGLEMIDGSLARGVEDASGSNALIAECTVIHHSHNRLFESFTIIGGKENPLAFVCDEFGEASDIRSNERSLCTHHFDSLE